MKCYDRNPPVSALRKMSHIFRNLARIGEDGEQLHPFKIKRMLVTLTRLADLSDYEVSCVIIYIFFSLHS